MGINILGSASSESGCSWLSFENVIMALRAYFDDSGHYTKNDETACIVGGFIARVEEWDFLESDWLKVVREYKVEEFHASALQSFAYCYKDWDENKRRVFFQDLVGVLKKHLLNPSKPLAALLPISQFKYLSADRKSQWGGDPYFVCLQDVIESAVIHASELYGPDERVAIICDQQSPKFTRIAERVYRACQKSLPNGSSLSTFGFCESRKLV